MSLIKHNLSPEALKVYAEAREWGIVNFGLEGTADQSVYIGWLFEEVARLRKLVDPKADDEAFVPNPIVYKCHGLCSIITESHVVADMSGVLTCMNCFCDATIETEDDENER